MIVTLKPVEFTKTRPVKSPERGTPEAAGIDFFVPDDWNGGREMLLAPHTSAVIPSGIHVKLQPSSVLIAFNKSGMATKYGFVMGACVIDSDYTGEVHLHLINTTEFGQVIRPGMKVAQFVHMPIGSYMPVERTSLDEMYGEKTTERGDGKFGSTGE